MVSVSVPLTVSVENAALLGVVAPMVGGLLMAAARESGVITFELLLKSIVSETMGIMAFVPSSWATMFVKTAGAGVTVPMALGIVNPSCRTDGFIPLFWMVVLSTSAPVASTGPDMVEAEKV